MAIDLPRRFFFYGTLIGGGPLAVRRALGRLRDLGPAHTGGLLYAIADSEGWYPALMEGPGEVAGRLYEATEHFAESDLAVLDAYEDCNPGDPVGSLYRRLAVTVADQPAELYRFNQTLPDHARLIPDGDFAAWIAREGLNPFGE